MKKLNLKNYEFLLDDDIYELYKNSNLIVNVSRNKPQLRIYDGAGYTSMSKIIMNSSRRTIFLDNNTQNLQRDNLAHSSPERLKASQKRFYNKNKDMLTKKQMEKYYQDKSPFLARDKAWREKNKEKLKAKRQTPEAKAKLYKQNRNPASKYRHLKSQAKIRKLELSIDQTTYTNIILNNLCHYCSKTLMDESGGSLDRIDNKIGYTLNNVLPCCKDCNHLRGNRLTVEETLVAVKAVLDLRYFNKCHGGDNKGLIQVPEKL